MSMSLVESKIAPYQYVCVTLDVICKIQSYPEKNRTDKFITRFLMRECVNQLTAVQRPLESASDHMDEEARDQK